MSVNQARMMAVLCVVLAIASAWRLGTLIFDFQFNYEMGVGLNDPSNLVEIVNDCPTDGVDCRCFGEPSPPLKVNGDVIIVDGNAGIGGDDPCNPTNKLTIEGFGKFTPAKDIEFYDGENRVVAIDCTDGSVTFGEGVTADEAARHFWKTLSDVYPEMFPKKCKCHEPTGNNEKESE